MQQTGTTFASLKGVHPRTAEALERQGITEAFPVQEATIPPGNRGLDLLVQSPTGSGKTYAFGIPIIEQIKPSTTQPTALILAPTRELAVQICNDLTPLARGKELRCAAVYGGASISTQAKQVRMAAIIVATPGRLDDLIRQRKINLSKVKILVLDEADRMLDMGFQPQVDQIMESVPGQHQTMLFSATLEGAVRKIAEKYTQDPVVIKNDTIPGDGGVINHIMMSTTGGTKVDTVMDALDDERDLAVIFVRTQRGADLLNTRLRNFGMRATAIHGGMNQGQRLREYKRFKEGTCDVLVATDVFARGMDCDRITTVINYDIPEDADTYRHRAGRTGRAGREGTAITMVMPNQRQPMKKMIREAGLPRGLFEDMRKPSGKKWEAAAQAFQPTESRGNGKGGRNDRSDRRNGSTPNATGNTGVIAGYNSEKGFGFIAPDNGGVDLFFHRSKISCDPTALRPGTKVTFGMDASEPGKLRAQDVELSAGGRSPQRGGRPNNSGGYGDKPKWGDKKPGGKGKFNGRGKERSFGSRPDRDSSGSKPKWDKKPKWEKPQFEEKPARPVSQENKPASPERKPAAAKATFEGKAKIASKGKFSGNYSFGSPKGKSQGSTPFAKRSGGKTASTSRTTTAR